MSTSSDFAVVGLHAFGLREEHGHRSPAAVRTTSSPAKQPRSMSAT
ncbi:hypothetical protein ACFFIA_30760 [Phytohabitans kaempferiae]|uniref:Uncharacterized protein n=1 Tax=Phytohabitans kaempferiae TaxID=1620943 RepID=A0ABV6MBG1_9ACTN